MYAGSRGERAAQVIRPQRPVRGVAPGAPDEGNEIMAIRDLGPLLRSLVRPILRSPGSALGAAAILLGFLIAGGTPAAAQGVVRSVYGDWQIRCETPPGAQSEQCALMQSVTAEDRPNVGLTVIVLKTADQKSRLMRVVAPLGILLPSGLGLKIDDKDVGRAGFVKCLPNGCIAEITMDDNLINELRTGHTSTFIIFQSPEEGIGFPMSLKGFGDGYDHLP
jgi:invasion protein IalB